MVDSKWFYMKHGVSKLRPGRCRLLVQNEIKQASLVTVSFTQTGSVQYGASQTDTLYLYELMWKHYIMSVLISVCNIAAVRERVSYGSKKLQNFTLILGTSLNPLKPISNYVHVPASVTISKSVFCIYWLFVILTQLV
jgi:hypothetical protein